jgi:hypothetical protein
MKFINQRDYPDWLYVTRTDMEGKSHEWGKTSTVFTSACGLCAAIMVADRLLPNCDFDLTQAIDLSYAAKANHLTGTDYARFAPAFAEKLGLDLETTSHIEDVIACLRTGGAAVALVAGDRDGKPGMFAHSGHYVAVVSLERDGRLAILDPYLYDGKYEEEGRKGKVELRNEVLILSDPQLLAEDVTTKSTPYYLFWRK